MGECSETGAAGEFRCGGREDARVCMYVCVCARHIWKLCDANDGAPQICRYRHMLQMLNVGDANDGAPQICRYRHMLQMLVYEGLRRRRCCATARLISKLCDANDGAPQICRYRHMLQMLVYEGQRRRRWCATANSSRNSATQTTVRHTHMLQMLNVCDANDRAKQIYTYRHMLQMLVYEGLRHRRWCASARNTCRYFMQMKRADTVCYNIVRLRCKRRCNTQTCIKSLRRKRQYNTDRDYAMCSKSLRQYKTDKHMQITSRKHMSIMSATQATVRHRNVYRKAATQTMVRHRQTHTDTSCTCNECLCVCMCTWDKDENEER